MAKTRVMVVEWLKDRINYRRRLARLWLEHRYGSQVSRERATKDLNKAISRCLHPKYKSYIDTLYD